MFCTKCGHRIDDDAAFCPNCGERIDNAAGPEPNPAPKAEAGAVAAENRETEQPLLVLDGGAKDILYCYADRVVISHRGALNAFAMGIKGDKTIYYTDITSVQYKQPGKIAGGYLQFSLPGGNENRGGLLSAMSDENTIAIISQPQIMAQAEKAVEFLNQKIREVKTRAQQPAAVVQQVSAADELKKFKELLDMGAITQEEFDAKKKQLLGL